MAQFYWKRLHICVRICFRSCSWWSLHWNLINTSDIWRKEKKSLSCRFYIPMSLLFHNLKLYSTIPNLIELKIMESKSGFKIIILCPSNRRSYFTHDEDPPKNYSTKSTTEIIRKCLQLVCLSSKTKMEQLSKKKKKTWAETVS